MFSDLPLLVRVALLLLAEERSVTPDARREVRDIRLDVLDLMTLSADRTYYVARETLDALQLFAYRGTR